MEAIQHSDYPPHRTLIKNYIVKTIPELSQIIKNHKMAITVERMQHGTLSYQSYLDKESSKYYMMMKNPMYFSDTVVIASKTWPFMEQLNRIVFMQQESGIRYYWEYLVDIIKQNICCRFNQFLTYSQLPEQWTTIYNGTLKRMESRRKVENQ